VLNSAFALLTAFLLVALYPNFNLARLAPVALAPFLFAMAREPRAWRRFLLGEGAGFLYWLGVCYWIQFVLEQHGGLGFAGSWLCFLLFCLAKALHFAVFGLLAGPIMNRWWAIPAVAALWTGIERTHGPLGFAWLTLGNAGIDMSVPIRLAPITGVYGLSFVLAMLSAGVAVLLLRRPRRHLLWLVALLALYLLPAIPQVEEGRLSAVSLQPNLPMEGTWSELEKRDLIGRLVFRTLRSALDPDKPAAALILWPETPGPFYFESDPAFRLQAQSLARTAKAPFLFGAVAFAENGSPLNSAQLINASGEALTRYDKMFLVPFGEFVPPLFGFVNRITKEAGDFAPGTKVVVSEVHGQRLGAFICYESAFPHLVRRFAAAGATVLLNLTNDGYFGRSAARLQHLNLARMRAVENRRWLLRPTNDGYTVSIDPAGRIRDTLLPFREIAGRLRYSPIESITLYTRYGDWFAWLCLACGLGASLLSWWPRYEAPGASGSKRH
jgi:apolipoprotein N-acyltransferase